MITIHHLIGIHGAVTARIAWNGEHIRTYVPNCQCLSPELHNEEATFLWNFPRNGFVCQEFLLDEPGGCPGEFSARTE